MSKKYITTAIPYVNARPHLGHVMDYLLADVWARHMKQQGHEVRYSAGLDEHGTKVEQKAREADKSPQEFVDDLAPSFLLLLEKLNASYTDFVRTTDTDHIRRVEEIWRKLDKKGVIYKSTYEGWYCSGCENFVIESEAKAMNYTCLDHQKPLEKLSEDNYYLRVSDYTDQIHESARTSIVPEFRGREILELIKDGAQDVSISRPKEKLAWGIPVPGDADQIMYVWVDALSNYITALGYPENEINEWWPADIEVVGKDILRFHAIIWPAMLLALDLPLPKKLLVHGFINVDGAKMSKSVGNVIDPVALVDEYGTDAVRYFFLRHVPTFDDGDYTVEKFIAAYNGELANDLGNLVSRTANMISRYCDGKIDKNSGIITNSKWVEEYENQMKEFRFDIALDSLWSIITELNRQIEIYKPWEKYKIEQSGQGDSFIEGFEGGSVGEFLSSLAKGLVDVSEKLKPFLPDTATKIAEIFGDSTVGDAPILFPKIEKK